MHARANRRSRPEGVDHGAGRPVGWLLTYSDMITLLMAFFIGLIAFYAKGPPGVRKAPDDAARMSQSFDQRTTVWRVRSRTAQATEIPGRPAFLYRDPPAEDVAAILHGLNAAPAELADGHGVRLPLKLLFDEHNRLTPSGRHLLGTIAAGVRSLPSELHFHVEKDSAIPRAVDVCSYLVLQEGFLPARLAVGSHPPAEGAGEAIWLVLGRHY